LFPLYAEVKVKVTNLLLLSTTIHDGVIFSPDPWCFALTEFKKNNKLKEKKEINNFFKIIYTSLKKYRAPFKKKKMPHKYLDFNY
jgi:hypothetical protein